MSTWTRWLKYAKAKLDSTGRSADEELDRREAELDARIADEPWLADRRDSPSYDDVKARIEREHPAPGAASTSASGDPAFDLATQQQAAAERLQDIRDSLGLPEDPKE